MGKSRSATVALAYLLWDSSRGCLNFEPPSPEPDAVAISVIALDVSSALALLRQGRPLAEPNDGFMKQLELYHAMGCPGDVESQPRYQRWLYKRTVQESLSINRAPDLGDVRFEDEQLRDVTSDSPAELTARSAEVENDPDLEIKCRKCRWRVASGDVTAEHQPLHGSDPKSCAHIFLHALSWMRPTLSEGLMDGRLICPNPKCGANIGKFAWQGLRCSCGGWVTPGFGVARDKVDEIVLRVSGKDVAAGTPARLSGGGAALRLPPGMRPNAGNL